MKIRELENQLFTRWKRGKESFVEDGIVNIKKYQERRHRVIYLLKEVNSDDNYWDLKDYLKSGARGSFWNNITRWTIGINNLDRHINWDEIDYIDHEKRKEILNSIGVINIKKEIGSSKSNNEELEKYTKNNSNQIKEQIDIYDPEIIICCGTSYLYKNFIYNGEEKWNRSSYGVDYIERKEGKYVISWKHPQWRVSANMMYYPLIESIKEILK